MNLFVAIGLLVAIAAAFTVALYSVIFFMGPLIDRWLTKMEDLGNRFWRKK